MLRSKISHYENETGSKYFPKKIQEYIPLVMDEEELKVINFKIQDMLFKNSSNEEVINYMNSKFFLK